MANGRGIAALAILAVAMVVANGEAGMPFTAFAQSTPLPSIPHSYVNFKGAIVEMERKDSEASVLDDALEAVTLLQAEDTVTPPYEGVKQASPRTNATV